MKRPCRRFVWKSMLCCCFAGATAAFSTPPDTAVKIDVGKLTREDVARMSSKELVNLPFEDLVTLANNLGVSVDELLNMKVSVSSKKALGTREAPGVITVVTDEEIINSGARDLVDVLRLVPGFEFGYDAEGATGIGVRGIWAEEGKVLLLIDGQEMNELNYSCIPIGSRFDVSQIKRIEILRGPGSCIYGGFAETGVINIITRKSDDINGAKADITYGQMPVPMGRANGTVEVGKFFKGGDFSLKMFGSTANRSDRTYTDLGSGAGNYVYAPKDAGLGGIFNNDDLMRLNAANINASASFNNLSARFIYDYYQTGIYETSYDSASSTYSGSTYPNKFKTYLGEVRYDWQLSDKLTVTPKINYKGDAAWQTDDPVWLYNVFVSRYTGNVLANYDYSDNLNVLGGFEGYYDDAVQDTNVPGYEVFSNGKKTIDYHNFSGFAQGVYKTKYVNFILGGRADYHNLYGWAFSPRVGVTGLLDKFHYKAIVSRAFRAPGIENIRVAKIGLNQDIKPEKTTDVEGEIGYQMTDNLFITANVFDISIKDPIIYSADNSGTEGYTNFSRTGSTGLELEFKTKYRWGYSSVNYSYTNPGLFDRNNVSFYEVPGHNDVLLAFPQNKVCLNLNYYLGKLSIDPSFTYLSSRFASFTGADGNPVLLEKAPDYLLNFYLRYNDLFVKGLTVGTGVYDVFNRGYDYIQPSTGNQPWPGPSREFVFRVTYDLKR